MPLVPSSKPVLPCSVPANLCEDMIPAILGFSEFVMQDPDIGIEDTDPEDGWTALHMACKRGHEENTG